MDETKQDIPDDLSQAERRFARRVIIATGLGLAASTALFINRPYIMMPSFGTPAHAVSEARPGPVPDVRRRLAPGRVTRMRLVRSVAPAPGGTRHRFVAATGPIDDNPFASGPAVNEELFALHGPVPHMQTFGSLYRLNPVHSYFLPQTHLALSDRLPLVWLKAAPVPEPDTWVTLIGGLMVTGVVLRRSARRAVC
jgi:hypothetical protein